MEYNVNSLDSVCAALAQTLGIDTPACAAAPNADLLSFAKAAFEGGRADRIFMYNPDAIAQWIDEKYAAFMPEVHKYAGLRLPLCSVMPSVTPVCFGTMYTGAQPAVHGIRSYTKPVIKIDSLFDAVIRSGKRAAIIGDTQCSMMHIYLERNMEYFGYETLAEINAKAIELICGDEYDLICVYNGNFDSTMHGFGPESPLALAELRQNSHTFGVFTQLIQRKWQQHNTLIGFAMDHGCHEIDGQHGSHGLDMTEDLNICHYYTAFKAVQP